MDLFMRQGGKKRGSPTPPDSFQKELQAKMKHRKKLGLSTDLTSSASERDSDGELESDDELMAHFNMTTKQDKKKTSSKSWKPPDLRRTPPNDDRSSPASTRSKSPYERRGSKSPSDLIFGRKTPNSVTEEDEDDDDDGFDGPSNLMMTMKKPMKPMDFGRRDGTKTLPNPKLRKSKTMGLVNEEESPRDKPWTPPSAKKHTEDEKENRPHRPKSPNVRGRKTPTLSLDSIEEERPKPSPRVKKSDVHESHSRPKPKPRGLSPKDRRYDEDSEDDEVMQLSSARSRDSPLQSIFRKPKSDTLKFDRKSPTDGKKTPTDGSKTPSDGRKTPSDGRKTPEAKKVMFGRNTPTDDKKTAFPSGGRKTPTDDRKTPPGGRKLTFGDRKSPPEEASGKIQKKSMLDMFSAGSKEPPKPKSRDQKARKKSLLAESDSDSDMGMGATRKSPSPAMRQRHTSDRDYSQSPTLRKSSRAAATYDNDDEVDGFRMLNKDRNRESPHFQSPSLKNRSRSPRDGSDGGSPWGETRKPSLRRQESVERDSDHDNVRNRRDGRDRRHYRDDDHDDYDDRQHRDRGRPSSRSDKSSKKPERDSSLCRDIDKDPTLKKEKEKSKQRQLAKAHTSNGRMLEDAIVSVENAQDKSMKFIDPDKEDKNNKEEVKTQKIPKHRPKARYAKPMVNTIPSRTSSSLSFNSTTDIRDAVYQEWYNEHQERAKKELKEKKLKDKELEEKKKKDAEDKILEAKASYNAWMEHKKEELGKKHHQKQRKETEVTTKKADHEAQQKKDADKTFKIWKENKDAYLREEQRKKLHKEESKRQDEIEKKHEKTKYSARAFEGWKEKKEEKLKTIKYEVQKTQKQKDDEERREQELRDKEALRSYDKWMCRKEKQQEREYHDKRKKTRDDFYEPRPAWSPASRTIPVGR